MKPEDYLKCRFGNFENIELYIHEEKSPNGPIYSPNLETLLWEFAQLNSGDIIVQIKNPRSGNWTIINKSEGFIIGHFENKLPNVLEATKSL